MILNYKVKNGFSTTPKMLIMKDFVYTIMSTDLVTITSDQFLSKARRIFLRKRVQQLPVTKGKKLVGLISVYDLWRGRFVVNEYDNFRIKDVMSTNITTLIHSDKVEYAAALFRESRLHNLLVVDDTGNLLGMVTSFDVMMYEFKKAYPNPVLLRDLIEPKQSYPNPIYFKDLFEPPKSF